MTAENAEMDAVTRSWKRFLAIGLGLVVICGLIPIPDTRALVAELIGIVGIVMVVVGARRWARDDPRPWYTFALGGGSFLFGNLVRAGHASLTGVENPFPSPADAFFVFGYIGVIAGVAMLVRRRSADVEGDNHLDALTVMTAIGVVMGTYLILPYAQDPYLTTIQKALTISYALGDLFLIGVTIRLAVGSGERNTSYYLLGGCFLTTLLTDALLTMQTDGAVVDRWISVSSSLDYVFIGAAALHPAMARLTDRPAERDIQLTHRRFLLLVGAFVLVPGLIAYETALGDPARTPFLGMGGVIMGVLVMGRLAGLVRSKEAKAAREAILREAAAALAGATHLDEMWHEAVGSLQTLTDADSTVVTIVDASGALEVVASTRTDDALHERLVMHPSARDAINRGELWIGPDDGGRTIVAPLRVRGVLQGALVATGARATGSEALRSAETLANQLALAAESLTLSEELHRRRHERRFRALIEHSSDLVTVVDPTGHVSFASPAARTLLGVQESDIIGEHPFARIHPDDRYRAAALLDRAWAIPGVLEPIEARFNHADGSWRWFEILVDNLLEEPEVGGVVIHARDVSDRRRAQQELEASEARFRSLVQYASDVVLVVDETLRLSYLSPSVNRLLGWTPEELMGTSALEIVHHEEAVYLQGIGDDLLPQSTVELRVRNRQGGWLTLEMTVTDLRTNPAVEGIVLNARDITERKGLEQELRHLALHDSLTGLPNRTLFEDRLHRALQTRSRTSGTLAVLYLDLDDFKGVNDGLGHTLGDEVLNAVSARILSVLRPEDTAARLGGDEFAVLIEELDDDRTASDAAQRILDAVSIPYRASERDLRVTASVGVAVNRDGSTAEALIRAADVAMYQAKTRGRNRVERFQEGMDKAFSERFELKRDLASALEDPIQLRLQYQPIFDLATGAVTGAEALVRWEHPTRGMVPPVAFIPIAEETGQIVTIGSWVLHTACHQLAAWRQEAPELDLSISVNLSIRQLEHPNLVPLVRATLEQAGVPPDRVVLEITESVLAADVDLVRSQFEELKAIGVRLAIDDFGTGYSSLGYLHSFPVDILKIDRSFVSSGDVEQRASILRTIVDLARSHGLRTVAEGIEEPEQAELLTRLGCDAGQGYLFSRPVAADQVLPTKTSTPA